jgi:hypothetical protein
VVPTFAEGFREELQGARGRGRDLFGGRGRSAALGARFHEARQRLTLVSDPFGVP